jgi:hypothetical protein
MGLWIGKDLDRQGKDDADQLYLVTDEWVRHKPVWTHSELVADGMTEDDINQNYKPVESEHDVNEIGGYKELGEQVVRSHLPLTPGPILIPQRVEHGPHINPARRPAVLGAWGRKPRLQNHPLFVS